MSWLGFILLPTHDNVKFVLKLFSAYQTLNNLKIQIPNEE